MTATSANLMALWAGLRIAPNMFDILSVRYLFELLTSSASALKQAKGGLVETGDLGVQRRELLDVALFNLVQTICMAVWRFCNSLTIGLHYRRLM